MKTLAMLFHAYFNLLFRILRPVEHLFFEIRFMKKKSKF